MLLDPIKYTCPDHDTDLTSQVQDALDPERPPVAYNRWRLLGRAAGSQPFEVPVICPGDAGAGPHQLTCTGTYTP